MVIHILDVILRREHVVVLKYLPSPLLRIVGSVETHAILQMRVERSGCLVLEKRSRMNESRATSALPFQSAENRCSEEPDPRQNCRGFNSIDALPLSICLGELTSG